MKCSMPSCSNKGKLWFNVWLVCEECFEVLMQRKLQKEHSRIMKGGENGK